jgi:hypothetical protein
MRTKLIVALVALLVLALAGGAWAYTASKAKTDCCYPGSPCCYPGSPCCDGSCCEAGSECCASSEKTETDCCDGSCCPDGPCCSGPCCTTAKAEPCCEK